MTAVLPLHPSIRSVGRWSWDLTPTINGSAKEKEAVDVTELQKEVREEERTIPDGAVSLRGES